jgi:hypothetical protein
MFTEPQRVLLVIELKKYSAEKGLIWHDVHTAFQTNQSLLYHDADIHISSRKQAHTQSSLIGLYGRN